MTIKQDVCKNIKTLADNDNLGNLDLGTLGDDFMSCPCCKLSADQVTIISDTQDVLRGMTLSDVVSTINCWDDIKPAVNAALGVKNDWFGSRFVCDAHCKCGATWWDIVDLDTGTWFQYRDGIITNKG